MAEIAAETYVLGISLIFTIIIVLLMYRHSNSRLMQKIADLKKKEREIESNISKVNEARTADSKELHKKIESLEHKLDVLLQPESQLKELAKEKIKVRARK